MDGTPGPDNQPLVPLSPLRVSARLVRRADPVEALRAYVPKLKDITVLDAERFLQCITVPAME